MIDLDQLETTAKAATPGPWRHPGRALVVSRMSEDEPLVCDCISQERFAQAPKDADYIAAVNPAVVLELVAELRAEREKYTNAVKAYKAVVQEGEWLAFQVYKPRRRCPPLQECDTDDIVTEKDCQQCWLNAAREAVEKEGNE